MGVNSQHIRERFHWIPFKMHWSLTQINMSQGFPCGSASKESAHNAGDLGSIPGWGRSHGEGNSYPPQYSGLENSLDCIVHGVTKSQIRLSDFQFSFLCSEISVYVFLHYITGLFGSLYYWLLKLYIYAYKTSIGEVFCKYFIPVSNHLLTLY